MIFYHIFHDFYQIPCGVWGYTDDAVLDMLWGMCNLNKDANRKSIDDFEVDFCEIDDFEVEFCEIDDFEVDFCEINDSEVDFCEIKSG